MTSPSVPAWDGPGRAARARDALTRAGVVSGPHPGVDEMLREASFVDHHVHGILRGRLPQERIIGLLSESDRPAAALAAGMDSQLGFAVRRWTAPLLDLAAHVSADEWLAQRASLDNEAIAARLLPLAGVSALLVDTGFQTDALTSPAELGVMAGAPAREVVRLEVVAERVAVGRPTAAGFAGALREALAAVAREAVGVKSILAYRWGFDLEPAPPSEAEVVVAAGAWLAAIEAGAAARLADPVLLRLVLWEGVALGLPLQLHTGYGDPDLDLHRADPLLLTAFLRRTEGRCPVLLLHTYPFHRNAGYLAQMFPHVFLDVGLAVNHSGVASERVIAESLEVTPFTKILFSSDAWGLPELHVLGSWLFRRGLSRVLGRWVADGDWSLADAARVVRLIGRENAERVYGAVGPG